MDEDKNIWAAEAGVELIIVGRESENDSAADAEVDAMVESEIETDCVANVVSAKIVVSRVENCMVNEFHIFVWVVEG